MAFGKPKSAAEAAANVRVSPFAQIEQQQEHAFQTALTTVVTILRNQPNTPISTIIDKLKRNMQFAGLSDEDWNTIHRLATAEISKPFTQIGNGPEYVKSKREFTPEQDAIRKKIIDRLKGL